MPSHSLTSDAPDPRRISQDLPNRRRKDRAFRPRFATPMGKSADMHDRKNRRNARWAFHLGFFRKDVEAERPARQNTVHFGAFSHADGESFPECTACGQVGLSARSGIRNTSRNARLRGQKAGGASQDGLGAARRRRFRAHKTVRGPARPLPDPAARARRACLSRGRAPHRHAPARNAVAARHARKRRPLGWQMPYRAALRCPSAPSLPLGHLASPPSETVGIEQDAAFRYAGACNGANRCNSLRRQTQ